MISGDFRNGITIEYDNNVYQIIEFSMLSRSGAAFVRTKLKEHQEWRCSREDFPSY